MHTHAPLYRSSSTSSISSDDSNISIESASNRSIDSADNATADANGAQRARTRKRFSSMQLMLLEQLYHQTSHPTREQREALARTIDMYVAFRLGRLACFHVFPYPCTWHSASAAAWQLLPSLK